MPRPRRSSRLPGRPQWAGSMNAVVDLIGRTHTCAHVAISVDTGHFVPGGTVTVHVACQVLLSDLAFPGVAGLDGRPGIRHRPTGPVPVGRLTWHRVAARAAHRRPGRRAPGGDEGAIAAFVLLVLVGLVALLGLVVDGGTALTARQAAEVEAEQAARAGAGAVSVDALRSGYVQIDAAAAVAAAEQFTVASGHPGTAAVAGGVVTVSVAYRGPDRCPRYHRRRRAPRVGRRVGGRRQRRRAGRIVTGNPPGAPRRRQFLGLLASAALLLLIVGMPVG